ncbi:MAG: GMC oxidoreductase [Nannocystales bacterium]
MALLDGRDLLDGQVIQGRVCIAGAGAAGITLARDLAASGVDVVLLEGGGLERSEDSQELYRGENSGDFNISLDTCRTRQLGGSTNCWAGWCRRLEADDFAARAWLEGSGWPVTAEQMEAYYARAHETVVIGANEYDAAGIAERAGAPALGLDPALARLIIYQYSAPIRFGTFYRDDLESMATLATYRNANVVNVMLSGDGSSVTQLDCSTLEGVRFSVQADHFVLSMGGIENARILLASNQQETAGVGNANGLVGTCFMEHPHYYNRAFLALPDDVETSFYTTRTEALTFDDASPEGIAVVYQAAISLPAAVREAEELVTMGATLEQINPDRVLGDEEGLQPDQLRRFIRSMPPAVQLLRLDLRAEQRPKPDSRIMLSDELDPLGVPRVNVRWKVADEDIADVQRTLELWSAALARARLGRLWMPNADGEFSPGNVSGGCHHMGTTRMSESAATGVVDANSRVHGIDNLFVAGSSVFPTGGFANPTLTIVALAHRLADHLGELVS